MQNNIPDGRKAKNKGPAVASIATISPCLAETEFKIIPTKNANGT